MALRIGLVTPFSWSQPHDVNEHVAGVASALRALGHSVTVIAPSGRAGELLAGRRALLAGESPDTIAIGAAVPVSRRSAIGVPVGVEANLTLALAQGTFDVVHGFEPGVPSISYLALRETRALTVATFTSPERLIYPPARTRRERLLGRVDVLLATTPAAAEAAATRFPGDYTLVSPGVDLGLYADGGTKLPRIVLEWRGSAERALAKAVIRTLDELPDAWQVSVLRTKPLMGRPFVPASLRERVTVVTARDAAARAEVLRDASIFVPGLTGLARVRLEAEAAGCAVVDPQGVVAQPELAGASVARLAEDDALREREGLAARARASTQGFDSVARELDALYTRLAARRRAGTTGGDPLEGRPWILVDLHMHTSWSHDCSMEAGELLDHAEAIGLGGIAVTDHNVFGGAQEAVELAKGRDLIVIPGEEVKTDVNGEVIGLFLEQEIPRGMTFADTIAAIKEQGGLVYLPHPFDRLHAIPDAATLHRHLADIDVFEVYNARLLFEGYNDEALRFARKYNLVMGAGSDAHVLQGLGTGALRMRAFEGPEEFLISLRSAEILRRPKSLAYLQSLKWVAQVKERVR
jgi:predicted metal-dependent phosphoesterase TrpH/glycosyltransferase involved in cell wall biosynthesis